jgi:putative membrane-bound dehydrogenase-like protein
MGSPARRFHPATVLALGFFFLHAFACGIEPDDSIRASGKKASLAAFEVREGFRIELVAAEPLVMDPVAIDWGADGRLWVAEMADYPLGSDGKGKPGGRVRFLEDTDGDGRYDSSVLFLDGLNFPTGVKAWKDGVLVTVAPEILFAQDTNGDGRADVREVLYKGFSEGNQQLRVNGLRWGLDNWIHCASGAHHGGYAKGNKVISVKTGETIVLGSRDFRIRPGPGLMDPQSGPSQFGRNRDDWGNWFGVQNSHPLWHYVLRDHHLRRNPYFVSPNPKNQVVTPSNPRVYTSKSPQKRFHSFEQSGRFTSACSGMVYRDELLFPRGSEGHAFTCEPFHNVVQHNIISRNGVTFSARRDPAESKVDFIASKDRWFRPVMVRTGPDGALWVVDMYRYMIEHPQWLPKNGQDELRPYFRHGQKHGRIYRVFPAEPGPRVWPKLQDVDPAALVNYLEHPNGWVRDAAQQELVQNGGRKVVGGLRRVVRVSRGALGRLHALCTLDGIGQLDAPTLEVALKDSHSGVRRQAVRLSAAIAPSLLEGLEDSDPAVRLELAVSARGGADIARFAADKDPWIAAAAMSSLDSKNVIPALESSLESPALFARLTAQAVAWKKGREAAEILERYLPGAKTEVRLRLTGAWLEKADPRSAPAAVLDVVETAEALAFDRSVAGDLRVAAIGLLNRVPGRAGIPLRRLLSASESFDIQAAAVRRVTSIELLLKDWPRYGPGLRAEILGRVLGRKEWATGLLDAVEAGKVKPGELDSSTRQRLGALGSGIKKRVQQLLLASPDRLAVLKKYRPALELEGDAGKGRVVFEKLCAACHKLGGIGRETGPNLAALSNKTGEFLLQSIIDPNAAVEARFGLYAAATRDGRTFSGMVTSETGTQLSLVGAEGKKMDILRGDIVEFKSMGTSFMPIGLERDLAPDDLADLIRFIREAR